MLRFLGKLKTSFNIATGQVWLVLKSLTDEGRTNLFKMDIQTWDLLWECKPYSITLKYQNFIDKDIQLRESSGCISESLSPWTTPVIILPKKPDPLSTGKQQLHLFVDYHFLNKSINATCNGNKVITYYPLPNITDLLARL